MKKLIITAAALMMAVATYGQGQFFFNTRDVAAGNDVKFTLGGSPATGGDLFLDILAGKDANSLAVVGTLPLNQTGARAGYPNPFSGVYTVPNLGAGQNATVGYIAYQGTSSASAANKSQLQLATGQVVLTVPPTPPNEVALGTASVAIIPEPGTMLLGLLGLGALLGLRRRS